MHELNGDAAEEVVTSGFALAKGGRGHGQQWAQALATGVDQVGGDGVEVFVAEDH